jgi:hypothetical protein
MTDRVLVFNRRGAQIAELDVSVTRAWKMTRVIESAKGQFTITESDPKATQANLRAWNIIYVESSSGVQPWAGIIAPDSMGLKDGVITVNLKSIEYILSTRATPIHMTDESSTASDIFQKLLYFYGVDDNEYPIEIDRAVFTPGGSAQATDYHFTNIYEALNSLANNSQRYWWLEPEYNDGRIQFIPYFVSKIGRVFGEKLIENDNFNDTEIEKRGDEFANSIIVFGQLKEDDEELVTQVESPISIGRYGRVEGVLALPEIDTEEALIPAGEAALAERAFPLLEITGKVTTSPFPRAGDSATLESPTARAILDTPGGMTIDVLVVSAAYSPETDEMFILVREKPEEGL